jgi:hypothetical protein
MIDFTKPIRHRDSHLPMVFCEESENYFVCAYKHYDGLWKTDEWDKRDVHKCIENIPEKIVGYLNIYSGAHDATMVRGAHSTRKGADKSAADIDRIACIRIEYEPGQFDE